MLAGVNDRLDHARALGDLLDPKVFKVNLIPYNPTGCTRDRLAIPSPPSNRRLHTARICRRRFG